jgi:hypothetical protein
MRISIYAPAVVLAFIASPSAHAQMFDGFVGYILEAQIGTVSVENGQTLNGDVPQRCELVYSVLVRDFEYAEGAFMSLDGAIAFVRSGDAAPRLLLELTAEYIDTESGYGMPYAPGSVYLVRGSETTRGEHLSFERREADGTVVTEYDAAATRDMVVSSLRQGAIALAFEREPFVPASPFEIDPTVVETDYNGERTHSPEMRSEFLACTDRLLRTN